MAAYTRTLLSIILGLFWMGLASIFIHNRAFLVPLFLACAVVTYVVIAVFQETAEQEQTP